MRERCIGLEVNTEAGVPGPQRMWREQGLGQHTLVQVQAEHVAGREEAQHHTECVKSQMADGKVEGPPRAQTYKQQEIDGCEG